MTQSAISLLAELTHRGVELRAVDDRLRYRPAGALPASLHASMSRHKAELLILVRMLHAPILLRGTWGRCASALLTRIKHYDEREALREGFEERAAICEFDGNVGAEDAERMAFASLCQKALLHSP